jgi:hypothetical protein
MAFPGDALLYATHCKQAECQLFVHATIALAQMGVALL